MTIRHVVLFSFPDGPDADYLARMEKGLEWMKAEIVEIASASWGPDLTDEESHFDYALILDFADRIAYETYRHHPAHRQFIADYMREVPMKKVRLQYEVKG